jgi:hypothetical protein
MGTNFYAIKQLPNSIKGKICELIETDRYDEAKKLFDDNYEKIHIGKSSFGWKFIFDYNHFKYYDLNRKSINDFLCRNDVFSVRTFFNRKNHIISTGVFPHFHTVFVEKIKLILNHTVLCVSFYFINKLLVAFFCFDIGFCLVDGCKDRGVISVSEGGSYII